MDGDLASAVRAVGKVVTGRREQLRLANGYLGRSAIRSDDPRVKGTRHELASGPFVMHHLFLGVG